MGMGRTREFAAACEQVRLLQSRRLEGVGSADGAADADWESSRQAIDLDYGNAGIWFCKPWPRNRMF